MKGMIVESLEPTDDQTNILNPHITKLTISISCIKMVHRERDSIDTNQRQKNGWGATLGELKRRSEKSRAR